MSDRLSGFGRLVIRVGDPIALEKLSASDQTNPKDTYVYGHFDLSDAVFYIGKGTARRAWSDDRHILWTRYVEKYLKGEYRVRILADGLSADDAEILESELIAQHGDQLVNWVNYGRMSDFKTLERFHMLRDANRKFIADTRELEDTDLESACSRYRIAVERIAEYAFLEYEPGLVGRLLREEKEEAGYSGELVALDRLTLCLIKSERPLEAKTAAEEYFAQYRQDLFLSGAKKIQQRIQKALDRKRR